MTLRLPRIAVELSEGSTGLAKMLPATVKEKMSKERGPILLTRW